MVEFGSNAQLAGIQPKGMPANRAGGLHAARLIVL